MATACDEEDVSMAGYNHADPLGFISPVKFVVECSSSDLSERDSSVERDGNSSLKNKSGAGQKRRLSTRNLKILRANGRHHHHNQETDVKEENKKTHVNEEKKIPEENNECKKSARSLWKFGVKKVHLLFDEWQDRNWDKMPTETARRYRYNYFKQNWSIDLVHVKMESEPFGHGAMRECFRIKKLSNFVRDDWKKPSTNFVAKRYLEEVERKVYEDDVILQSVAKVWGEMYNLMSSVKKKVDICQMCLIEFHERPDTPVYHLESFIPGEYIKYNSNSGFVENDEKYCRNTPHAFSHFSFEYSGHSLIVVDIQGVGDLYTDPQIHTNDGQGFGDGNLGTRGMALFFHTHRCNAICNALGLAEFDLTTTEIVDVKSEQQQQANSISESSTNAPLPESNDCTQESQKKGQRERNFHTLGRSAFSNLSRGCTSYSGRMSCLSECGDDARPNSISNPPPVPDISHLLCHSAQSVARLHSAYNALLDRCSTTTSMGSSATIDSGQVSASESISTTPLSSPATPGIDPSWNNTTTPSFNNEKRTRRLRNESSCSDAGIEEAKEWLLQHASALRRSSCVIDDSFIDNMGNSTLAMIHHDLALLHESGRFVENHDLTVIDWNAIYFHEDRAASLGHSDALLNMARLHLGLPGCLFDVDKMNVSADSEKGFSFMHRAAETGVLIAMIFVAESYDEGRQFCSQDESAQWEEAAAWYERIVDYLSRDGLTENGGDKQLYQIQARLAEMLAEGGKGLDRDPTRAYELYYEAAENATAAMKGRLAAKYYEAAELIEE